jgi:putative oxidoreductase
MTVVRAIARPLLSTIFIVQGVNAVRNPEPLVPKAQPVTDKLVPMVKKVAPPQIGDRIPETTAGMVRLNGAAQVVGGLALASGRARRPAAALLAALLVPTTVAGHPFWSEKDKDARNLQRIQFMKNLSLLGGLMLAAVDTEGKPGLVWRAGHLAGHAQDSMRRAAATTARETRRAAKVTAKETRRATEDARRAAQTTARETRLAVRAARLGRRIPG